MRSLIILGAGGFARETYCWLPKDYHVKAFYSNQGPTDDYMFGTPVVRDLDGFHGSEFVCAVGDPKIRKIMWEMAIDKGLRPCNPIVHPSAVMGFRIEIREGSIICPSAIITTNVKCGRGLILNIAATIGHDSILGDFVTVSPGANISGNVSVGDGCYIGTNACIREKVSIGPHSTIGMGGVVVGDIPSMVTAIGNPARQMRPK